MAAIIAGKPNPAALSEIDLKEIAEKFRTRTIVFETAKRIFNSEKPNWKGSEALFLAQIIRLVAGFISGGKLLIPHKLFQQDALRRRVLIMLNMNKIVQHVWNGLRAENSEKVFPVFDTEHPIRNTAQMRIWDKSKPCEYTKRSHINHVVVDSRWEASEAWHLEKSEHVSAWVKNDHLGFTILYNHKGVVRKYFPDFLIRLKNGHHLVVESKGRDSVIVRTKQSHLQEWAKAVNHQGGVGRWHEAISYHPNDLADILKKAVC